MSDNDRLNLTRCPAVPTASSLAYQLGYLQETFADEPGLDIEYASVGFTGKLDYAHHERLWLRHAGHAPAVWARAQGVASRVVALAWLEGSYPVLSLAGSGIDTPAGLKGKRLGIIGQRAAKFDLMIAQQLKVYATTLAEAGLTLDDAELVYIDRPSHEGGPSTRKRDHFVDDARVLASNLILGQVDAIIARLPEEVASFVDVHTVYDTRHHPDPRARVHPSVLRGVVVSEALLTEHRDLVVRYLAQLLRAGDWALANPDASVALIASDYNVPEAALAGSYDSVAEGIQLRLDPDIVDSLRVQKDFLLHHGFIAADFDLDAWVDPEPLREAQQLVQRWRG